MFLFQTPVPNYKDVELSSYEFVKPVLEFAKMENNSLNDISEKIFLEMIKLPGHQLSSPQIQDFIRLAKCCLCRHLFIDLKWR
jgi:hypothetical protein